MGCKTIGRSCLLFLALTVWGLASLAYAQGGFQGGLQGGFQGGFQGGGMGGNAGGQAGQGGGSGRSGNRAGMGRGLQGQAQQGIGQKSLDEATREVESKISRYLDGEELKSILTPGEFVEYKLDLKAGQVLIGEARSDAFDPALEVVDEKGKVLGSNDDRYPGDQRPLLLWRCEKDGPYLLHVRCFHDKSGGQVFTRFRIYNSIDLPTDGMVEKAISDAAEFLIRIPMKGGQIKTLRFEPFANGHPYMSVHTDAVISSSGLPCPDLAPGLAGIGGEVLVAPVTGDYYLLGHGAGRVDLKARLGTQEIVPVKATLTGGAYSSKAPTGTPAIWEISVKAGDFLKVSTPELSVFSLIRFAEVPKFDKFDTAKEETNPFIPHEISAEDGTTPVMAYPARARDGRITVFRVTRDAKLWLASNAAGPAKTEFTFNLGQGAANFVEEKANTGNLGIGSTDYWSFEAKAGDVLTFESTAKTFWETLSLYDPSIQGLHFAALGLDETKLGWQTVVQKPGKYLVQVGCEGNGGSGEYTLLRKSVHPSEFSVGHPATGEIGPGQVVIWKFTAEPNKPLLIHWNASDWNFGLSVYDDKGNSLGLQRESIDGKNAYGILKVEKTQTFVIVLNGTSKVSKYSFELNPLGSPKN